MPARIGPKKPVRVYLAEWRGKELTQEQLGQRIHPPVDKGTVSKWENAKPGLLSLGVIAAYAEALGRPVQDMYRRPTTGPSLDALADGLDTEQRDAVVKSISAMQRRKAS